MPPSVLNSNAYREGAAPAATLSNPAQEQIKLNTVLCSAEARSHANDGRFRLPSGGQADPEPSACAREALATAMSRPKNTDDG